MKAIMTALSRKKRNGMREQQDPLSPRGDDMALSLGCSRGERARVRGAFNIPEPVVRPPHPALSPRHQSPNRTYSKRRGERGTLVLYDKEHVASCVLSCLD